MDFNQLVTAGRRKFMPHIPGDKNAVRIYLPFQKILMRRVEKSRFERRTRITPHVVHRSAL